MDASMTAIYTHIGGLGGLGLSESLERNCGAAPTKAARVSKRLAALGSMRTQTLAALAPPKTANSRKTATKTVTGGLGETTTHTTTYTPYTPRPPPPVCSRARPGIEARRLPGGTGAGV